MPTGIDRVEYQYVKAAVADVVPAFGLARTALGFVLIDKPGLQKLCDAVDSGDWGAPDLISRLNARLGQGAKLGQSFVRRLAIGRARRSKLASMLQRHFSGKVTYFNVGHSNLSRRLLSAVDSLAQRQIVVMVHDTIPLDYPQYQRPESVERFLGMLGRVSKFADMVICVSNAESARVRFHLEEMGRCPELIACPLGVELPPAGNLPNALKDERFFMTLGTIEPRKNHGLLLDVWEKLGPDAPILAICGSRGWMNEAVLSRLDGGVPRVIELPGLSDQELRAMMERTQGFLFPSFAEGFGLPPVEAAMAGAPVICADLPSCREILGSKAVYLDPTDSYQWEKEVKTLIGAKTHGGEQPFVGPTWDAHFKTVFTIT